MGGFSILSITGQLGESIVVSGVTRSYNSRGDVTESYSSFNFSGAVVEVLNAEDDLVKEGIFQVGDIQVFVDESEANSFLANDNYVWWGSVGYIIREVVVNKGHYQVLAKRTGI